MTSFYHFYCPYCKHLLRSRRRRAHIGSPLIPCRKCGSTCIDPFTQEPAFNPYREYSIGKLFLSCMPRASWCSFIVSLLAFYAFPSTTFFLLCLAATFLLFWLLFFLFRFVTRSRFEQKRLETWEKSDSRLRDPKYAAILKNFGFSVPPQYLPADFKRSSKGLPYKPVLVKKPSSFKKYPAPQPHQIDSWHPERD